MNTVMENDPDSDCQMQPLDLSCPKPTNFEQLSPRSRPRSSSGGSEESSPEFEASRPEARDLVKAAALLRNCGWNMPPILTLDGPARKRFLTKYLHKSGKSLYY